MPRLFLFLALLVVAPAAPPPVVLNAAIHLQLEGADLVPRDGGETRVNLFPRRLWLGMNFQQNAWPRARAAFRLESPAGLDHAWFEHDFPWFVSVRAGWLEKDFTGEARAPACSLRTLERSFAYDFLGKRNGYLGHDLGVVAAYAWGEGLVIARLGAYTGVANDNGYDTDHPPLWRGDPWARDFTASVSVRPRSFLEGGAGVSLKGVDDPGAPEPGLVFDAAWNLAVRLRVGHLAVQGDATLGRNHFGADSLILRGGRDFVSFQVTPVLALPPPPFARSFELAARFEGLDPAVSSRLLDRNDAQLGYYFGANLYFHAQASAQVGWSLAQPLTAVAAAHHRVQTGSLLLRVGW